MDPYTFQCDAISGTPRVLAFKGDEQLGRCFEYDICLSLDEADSLGVTPADLLGEPASLTIGTEDAITVSGHIADLEILEDVPSAVFRLRLVPGVWFLRRSSHNRVFVDASIPEILEKVLKEAGIPSSAFEMRLTRSYAKRDHVCQYQESDLDFLERWMQREGLYSFFEHGDDGSKMVICDASSAHSVGRAEAVVYHPVIGADESSGQHFGSFRALLRALPVEVGEADYNYLTPDAVINASEKVAPELSAKVQSWAENERDQSGAARVAGLRAELQKSGRKRYQAVGREIAIHAGFTFSVDRHPAGELNRDYLAVRVLRLGQLMERGGRIVSFFSPSELRALGREMVWVEIEAIASDVQFRPARTTPWPLVGGFELGLVDGPDDSDYSQIDEHGRYLVKLMMDENPSPAGKASTRIRMIQPHGGKQEGYHLPLRKGTEVLIAFIGGDPDRPVIAGAVPNVVTPSPVKSANNTQNVVQTGGKSRLEVEDKDGQQYIDVSTPPEQTFVHLGVHAGLGDHNVVISTAGDGRIHTGTNRDITIGGDQNEDVKGNLTETYHSNQTTHVTGAFTETIDAGSVQTIHAGLTQTITGGLQQSITEGELRTVSGGTTETVNGSRIQSITGGTTETVSATQNQTITGGATVISAGMYTVKADGGITLKTDGPMNMMANTWLMNAPGGQTNMDDNFLSIASEHIKTYNILCRPNIVNINIAAIALSAIGARRDMVRNKFELAGLTLQNRGFATKAGAVSRIAFGASFAFGFLTFL